MTQTKSKATPKGKPPATKKVGWDEPSTSVPLKKLRGAKAKALNIPAVPWRDGDPFFTGAAACEAYPAAVESGWFQIQLGDGRLTRKLPASATSIDVGAAIREMTGYETYGEPAAKTAAPGDVPGEALAEVKGKKAKGGPLAGVIDKVLDRAADGKPSPATDHTSPENLAKHDAKTVRMMNEQSELIREREGAWEEAHKIAAARKKDMEEAQEDLVELIEERRKSRGKPVQQKLFPDPDEADEPAPKPKPTPTKVDPQAAEGRTKTPDTDKAPDDWKPAAVADAKPPEAAPPALDKPPEPWEAIVLDELKSRDALPDKVFAKLLKDGFHTLGDLVKYMTPSPATGWTGNLSEIKGFTKKDAEQVDDALTRFWTRWEHDERRRSGAPVPAGEQADAGKLGGVGSPDGATPGDATAGTVLGNGAITETGGLVVEPAPGAGDGKADEEKK